MEIPTITNYHKTPETFGATVQVVSGNPNSVLVTRNSVTGWGVVSDRITNIVAGQVYTLSFELKTNDVTRLDYIHIMDSDEGNVKPQISINITADGQWHKYIVTFTSPVTRSNAGILIAADYNKTLGNQFELRKLKLELGNKATDWTPAPEDINAHPFVAELAKTVYRSKLNEERIRALENAITALGGGN